MGYGVYFRDGRWAGYGVPAECDMPNCSTEIDRGLAYKCETHDEFEAGNDEGCGLFFCETHRYDAHAHESSNVVPKPDSAEWIRHMLTDESWAQWRHENPDRVAVMRTETGAN